MDEFEIIRRYFVPDSSSEDVVIGIGDDGAVLRPDASRDLVTVIDTLVAGVHFPQKMRPQDIAYRAVAVNVSDIAAMGARPRWMTCAITLTNSSEEWLAGFAEGLRLAAKEYQVELVGGDTTRGSECVVTVQITGDVAKGMALTRSGAQPGDSIFVSGTPGDAACGLSLLQDKLREDGDSDSDNYLIRRFTNPNARVELGLKLSGIASAAIDVSDGLYADLEKLLQMSAAGGSIELLDIPLSGALRDEKSLEDSIALALGGGDDYELCFTAPPAAIDVSVSLAGVPIARIGEVNATPGLFCTQDGNPINYHDKGYRHFSE
jgi:thiamine-monophosphate kinase